LKRRGVAVYMECEASGSAGGLKPKSRGNREGESRGAINQIRNWGEGKGCLKSSGTAFQKLEAAERKANLGEPPPEKQLREGYEGT